MTIHHVAAKAAELHVFVGVALGKITKVIIVVVLFHVVDVHHPLLIHHRTVLCVQDQVLT
jgi:hypothetical protein